MQPLTNRRKYSRFEFPICKVLVSKNKKSWLEVNVVDLSAGGIRFRTELELDILQELFVDMIILNKYSEFELKLTGKVARKDNTVEQGDIYALEFINIEKKQRVQLDELINSLGNTSDDEKLDPEQGDGMKKAYGIRNK